MTKRDIVEIFDDLVDEGNRIGDILAGHENEPELKGIVREAKKFIGQIQKMATTLEENDS